MLFGPNVIFFVLAKQLGEAIPQIPKTEKICGKKKKGFSHKFALTSPYPPWQEMEFYKSDN